MSLRLGWRLLLCLAALACTRAQAAFDVYLQVTPAGGQPLIGESRDVVYKGWIELAGFGAGLENALTFTSTSTSFGKPRIREFTLLKSVDRTTPLFFDYLTKGATLDSLRLVLVVSGRDRVEFWELKATQCAITRQEIELSSDRETPRERLAIAFGTMEWTYTQVDLMGDPSREHFAFWDAIRATGGSGTRTLQEPGDPGSQDSDGDGLPDQWETLHGLNPQVPDSDTDHDGDLMPARLEYLAGTDPKSPQSVFRVLGQEMQTGSSLRLVWSSVPGRSYRVTQAANPGGPYTTWQTITATAPTTEALVPISAERVFFRIETP